MATAVQCHLLALRVTAFIRNDKLAAVQGLATAAVKDWIEIQINVCDGGDNFVSCALSTAQPFLCRAVDGVPGVADDGGGEQEPP